MRLKNRDGSAWDFFWLIALIGIQMWAAALGGWIGAVIFVVCVLLELYLIIAIISGMS